MSRSFAHFTASSKTYRHIYHRVCFSKHPRPLGAHSAPEALTVDPPAPADVPQAPAPVEFTFAPKIAREGHRIICEVALPVLREVMQERKWESKAPLLQAREALRRVDLSGQRFWGVSLTYSRKYTVEEIIVSRYHSEVRLSLLA